MVVTSDFNNTVAESLGKWQRLAIFVAGTALKLFRRYNNDPSSPHFGLKAASNSLVMNCGIDRVDANDSE